MKKYFNFKDKRAITLTLIAIITLLSLIIGATYAYFIASENLLTTSRTLEVTTNNTTSVVATGNATLTMDLNLDDMRKFGETKTYYATRDGKTETETEEDFINIQSTSSTKVYCTYTAELTKNDTENYSNMIDQIIANGKEDEMVLTFLCDGVVKNTFDMKTAVWDENNKIRFTGILSDIDPNGSAVLDAKLYLRNLANVDQTPYLAQSALNLQMKLTSVNCDTMDTPMITSLALNPTRANALDVTMNDGAYELASYCVDQVERSTGECENWISNNDKIFTAFVDAEEPGEYYLHVKDIRGYIADSAVFSLNIVDEPQVTDFYYTGAQQSLTVSSGEYKLEVWGAQGGNSSAHGTIGGYGGYSVGVYYAAETTDLYVYVGGAGAPCSYGCYGGWNGGGVVNSYNSGGYGNHIGTGGGATDIATIASPVTADSYYRYVRTPASYASRLIVAGGGGGAEYGTGDCGGGASGCGSYGGTQTGAGAYRSADSYVSFYGGGLGYGISVSGGHTNHAIAASGGAGYYGGGTYGLNGSNGNIKGSGGSGYIGGVTSNDTVTRTMYCYNCAENTNETMLIKKTTAYSADPLENTAKASNGHARITALKTIKLTLY